MTAGDEGLGSDFPSRPVLIHTNAYCTWPFASATTSSDIGASACRAAHFGSASILIFLRRGGSMTFTTPVIEPPSWTATTGSAAGAGAGTSAFTGSGAGAAGAL